MKKTISILIFCTFMSISLQARQLLIRIDNADTSLRQKLDKNNVEITYSHADRIDILLDERDLAFLQHYEYRIIDDTASMQRELAGYRDYEDTLQELQQIADDNSDITQLFSLGNSTCYDYYNGGNTNYQDFQFEIWCLKLSDNPTMEEDEPNIFYAAEIHAREPISLEVDMYILNYLVSNYNVIDSVTAWIDSTQIWFIPLMNPDGHKLVTEGWHTMHRKNMRDNNGNGIPDHSTADGVDLNRNFGYVWGSNGTSPFPNSNLYNGPNAWSEQEICYVRDLLTSRKFSSGITYHSYGEWVLYPLGHLPGVCSADHLIMDDMATQMAVTIPKMNGIGNYTPAQAVDFGYTCQGTMGDWGYAAERIFAFTIELANTFIPSAVYVDQICQDNLQAALIMLDRLHHSAVTGTILNTIDEKLKADVIIPQVDEQAGITQVEPVRSDSLFGRYRRMLLPGTYTMRIEKTGYLTQTIENINIVNDSVTEQNVVMITEFLPADSIQIAVSQQNIDLSWSEENFNHEIYSTTSPDGEFQLESNGNFTSSSSWQEPLTEEKKFYKIKRIAVE